MALRDLGAFLEDDGLEYPGIKSKKHPEGKTYRVPSPDARTGLWLTALANLGVRAAAGDTSMSEGERDRLKLDDDEEKTLYQHALGKTYDEMCEDGVSWTTLCRIGKDAYLCFSMSEQVADMVLASPGEAPARPNRAARRTAKKTAGRRSPRASTATATRTPTPGSSGSSTSPTGPEGEAKAV